MFRKELTSYFAQETTQRTVPYIRSPGTTFLTEVVEICNSVNHCSRTFTKKQNGDFTKDSIDSFQRIVTSAYTLLMSHFETFQRGQFAELVNTLDFLDATDDIVLAQKLEKEGCTLSLRRILAGRGEPREPGQIIADALTGWHNPERVNVYFRTVFPEMNIYSNSLKKEFELMWQLRHSIVHTGGLITREDAMKVPALRGHSDRQIIFGEDFMPAVGRRFHIMIKNALERLRTETERVFRVTDSRVEDQAIINSIVGLSSPRQSWLR